MRGSSYGEREDSETQSYDANEFSGPIRAVCLTTSGMADPVAVDDERPSFGWHVAGEGAVGQRAYHVHVASSRRDLLETSNLIWDSGRVEADSSNGIRFDGSELRPGTRYWWTVRVWDLEDRTSAWTKPATFRTGRLTNGIWNTSWIAAPPELRAASGTGRVFYFGRRFELTRRVVSAYVSATARGIYRLALNGRSLDMGELAPGWTAYETRFHYQTKDVRDLIQSGENFITVAVAPGWWSGHIAWWGRNIYGDHGSVSVELRIEYDDGELAVISTGEDWRVAPGTVVESDLIYGEIQDRRQPGLGPDCLALIEERSAPARVERGPAALVLAQEHEPIRVFETLSPVSVVARSQGHAIIDFGRNLTGRVRLRLSGERGAVVTLRHAEALNPDGSLYMANLRTTRQEDRFVLSGSANETLVPQFTLHGFRYVDIRGYEGQLEAGDLVAEVMHSDLPVTGTFRTSNTMTQRLHDCIVVSQRSNFVDIPVDCYQRDERLGWTGDINLFAPTALFNMDCSRFLRSWVRSLSDCQLPSGSIPDVAPYVSEPLPPRDVQDGQAGWGDAMIGIPWELYVHTGDRGVLEENWEAMVGWMNYLQAEGTGSLRSGGIFGDWNALGDPTPSEVIGTAWYARSSRTMARVARALDRTAESSRYRDLFQRIQTAFQEQLVSADGRVLGETQTAYAMALDSGLIPKELRTSAVEHLVEEIENNDWHLSTGFVGTACILPALCDEGRTDVAYRLVTQTTYPSWGFELEHGATSIWEHWDSWRPEVGFHDPKMNSLNHYSFATVGAWLYRYAAGINPDPERPGYRRILFRPHPNAMVGDVSASFESAAGRVASSWSVDGKRIRLALEVPPNCVGLLESPWLRNELDIEAHEGNRMEPMDRVEGRVRMRLEAGRHSIVTRDLEVIA